ncbi:MAG: ABC transporter ATP-binding protein [Ruminococcus sp.]|uniref:ABC transporter ATP-binding protein n=1 Tax=Ruminococcus sp. TaxID=41978 RepID=UPI002873C21E|nr:ABC transporter ATP-binding protein [Ruminococcus sp.]MBQ3285458.1 ABC transporter ATP-binding protein [Ruminococcus sp.]
MSENNTSQKQYIKKSREQFIGADSKRPQAQKGFGGPKGVVTEKSDNFGAAWKNLLSYAKPQMPAIIIAMTCAVIGTIIALIGPKQIQKITDLITQGITGVIDLEAVTSTCVFLLVLYGVSWLMNFVQHFIMATVAPTVSSRMRRDITEKTNRLPLKYFDSTPFGDILSRITNDIDTIERTLNLSIAQFITSIALFFGSAAMMFITNWILALTAIVASVIGFFLMSVIMKKSQLHFNRQQRHLGAINGHVEEIYSGHNIVKAYNYEKESKEEFSRINRHLRDSVFKSTALSGVMQPLMTFIGNLGFVAVFVVGALLVKDAVITFGVIIEFTIYVRLFTQPLQQLAQSFSNMQSTAAAADRVFEYLGEEELSDESSKTKRLDTVKGHVRFDHVHFGYNPDKIIINDFSVDIPAGQKVAIVGPTGAGKTTIVNLLMRFYELNSGRIFIDGVPIDELTRENVHDLFCMVLQDTWLFEGTVRENLVYSKEGVTDEELERACKAVGIHHFIRTLPNGYDTVLDDKASLSAGQKQQLTIARAMIENAPLLILDEATSSVDTRTERIIQKAMDSLTEGRTSFVIAHRLSTIKNSDLILVLKDGDIIASGTHDELIAEGGFYADLYNSQFEQSA